MAGMEWNQGDKLDSSNLIVTAAQLATLSGITGGKCKMKMVQDYI